MTSAIISAADALALQSAGQGIVFLDVRFAPNKPDSRADYQAQHIAGAHYVDLGTQLQGQGGGTAGARPLPGVEQLQQDITRWGINPDSLVIVYSDKTHAAAARAWFVLEWAGHKHVKFLDGGLNAWIAAGGPTSTETPADGHGTFEIATTGHLPTASADEIAGLIAANIPVFDARDPAGYEAGHIPGARSISSKLVLDETGHLLPKPAIEALFAANGAKPGDTVGVYCGGGVAAALESLALREIGIDARHFVGSFSAWSADPARPVAQAK
jgi:thiosulfate/3-mercaptopyruvate sulfurtransferase